MEKETTTTNRKRKLAEQDEDKSTNGADTMKNNENSTIKENDNSRSDNDKSKRKEDRLEPPSLPSLLTNRPVRRKLCFDNVAGSNDNNERTLNHQEATATNNEDKPFLRPCPFNVEVENLLNSTLEQNRKRCIEKYNFDPVLEKALEGKYKWEKV